MWGAPVLVKFDERYYRRAHTGPGAAALYGITLVKLDDDHGLNPTRTRSSSTTRRGSPSPAIYFNNVRVSPPERTAQFSDPPDRYSYPMAGFAAGGQVANQA